MNFTRTDLQHADEVINHLGKLRFDLNGIEVMKLSNTLKWFGTLRTQIAGELEAEESKAQERIDEALRLMASHQAAAVKTEAPKAEVPQLLTQDLPDEAFKLAPRRAHIGKRK